MDRLRWVGGWGVLVRERGGCEEGVVPGLCPPFSSEREKVGETVFTLPHLDRISEWAKSTIILYCPLVPENASISFTKIDLTLVTGTLGFSGQITESQFSYGHAAPMVL